MTTPSAVSAILNFDLDRPLFIKYSFQYMKFKPKLLYYFIFCALTANAAKPISDSNFINYFIAAYGESPSSIPTERAIPQLLMNVDHIQVNPHEACYDAHFPHLCNTKAAWREYSYSAVYNDSIVQKTFDYRKAKQSYEDRAKILEDQNTLIVIVPGIFSEFIESRAFEALYLRGDSQFSSLFKQRLELAPERIKQDQQFKLKNISFENPDGFQLVNLDQLFHFGKTTVNGHEIPVVLFQTAPMTLETLGDTKSRATTFNRRLTKLFQVIGEIPDSIVLVGYSRGATFALEMLNQGNRQKLPWIDSVKSMASLGGVIHGSILADNAFFNEQSKEYKILQNLEKLTERLQYPIYPSDRAHDIIKNLEILLYNSKEIGLFISQMLLSQLGSRKITELGRSIVTLDIGYALKQILKQIEESGLFTENMTQQYVFGVKRLRLLLKETLTALRELSTYERAMWWRDAVLPQHVQYASISAVMGMAHEKGMQTKLAYNTASPDFKFLTTAYRDFLNIDFIGPTFKGIELNDSQVDIASSQFNIANITRLNSKNSGLSTLCLGVVNSHHWGLALPFVNRPNSKVANPFPREALLKAVALRLL